MVALEQSVECFVVVIMIVVVSRGEWGCSGTATQNHQKRQGYPLGKNAKMAKNIKNESPPRAPKTFNNR
eukprot:SAG22_NODE_3731_length_1554_cov_4.191065_1_plen_68_part_10